MQTTYQPPHVRCKLILFSRSMQSHPKLSYHRQPPFLLGTIVWQVTSNKHPFQSLWSNADEHGDVSRYHHGRHCHSYKLSFRQQNTAEGKRLCILPSASKDDPPSALSLVAVWGDTPRRLTASTTMFERRIYYGLLHQRSQCRPTIPKRRAL
jgi:hypothetical protein